MLLIGFGHKARQGKNTAALAFLEQCPLDSHARLHAFADALRQEVRQAAIVYGSEAALIDAWKESGIMPDWVTLEIGKQRSLYQWYGTDFRRAQDPLYWIKRLDKTLQVCGTEIVLIPDVRFPNEGDYIKSKGGILVKVVNTNPPDVVVRPHDSENAMNTYTLWDHKLIASGVADLKKKAHSLYGEIGIHGNRTST